MRTVQALRALWQLVVSFVIAVPEGSTESDYQGKKFCFGRLGRLELYLSIVLKARRYLFAIGYYRSAVSFWKSVVWFRRNSWTTKRTHRWSGWPGAFCMLCGADDVIEYALGCSQCSIPCCPEDEGVVPFKLCAEHQAYADATKDCR